MNTLRPRRSWAGMVVALASVAAAGIGLARPAVAQDLRLVSSSHRATGEPVRARVFYTAGVLRLQAADPGRAYSMTVRYDDEQFRLIEAFDPPELTLGVEGLGRLRRDFSLRESDAEFDVRLGPDTPMRLQIEFGAGEGWLDLGGLHLDELQLSTGASTTHLTVSRPTAQPFDRADFEVGAAEFEALELGNLQVRRLDVAAGVGDLVLDFSGQLLPQTELHLSLGLGNLELRIPDGVGVRVNHDSFLASLDLPGLNENGGAWYSPNWYEAERRIDIDLDAAFGEVSLVWLR